MVKPSLQPRRPSRARFVRAFLCVAAASALWFTSARPLDAQFQPGRPEAGTAQLDVLVRLADEVAKEVEALRGWSFKQPITKQLATPEQVRQYVDRQMAAELPPRSIPLVQAMLRTIGLIPSTCDLKSTYLSLMENQVAGFYDAATHTMNLVQRPDAMPPIVERMMLAHELTHALDDQYADLATLVRPSEGSTEDSDLVVSAVTEGSATSLMLQYMVKAQAAGRLNMSELTQYAAQEAERSRPFLDAPRYFSSILASYICGTQFLAKGNLLSLVTSPDNRAIGESFLAARKDLPRSTEQILHPSKYWVPADRDEPVRIDDAAVERWLAQPGRWIVRKDTIGELLVGILTTPKDQPLSLASLQAADAWSTPAARGWGGDRFFLLASGASAADAARALQNLKGVWVTAWDTPVDRDEFAAALAASSMPPSTVTMPLGADVALVFVGFDAPERTALIERLGDRPLVARRDGNWCSAPGQPQGSQPTSR
jgi:hypothetical protein